MTEQFFSYQIGMIVSIGRFLWTVSSLFAGHSVCFFSSALFAFPPLLSRKLSYIQLCISWWGILSAFQSSFRLTGNSVSHHCSHTCSVITIQWNFSLFTCMPHFLVLTLPSPKTQPSFITFLDTQIPISAPTRSLSFTLSRNWLLYDSYSRSPPLSLESVYLLI